MVKFGFCFHASWWEYGKYFYVWFYLHLYDVYKLSLSYLCNGDSIVVFLTVKSFVFLTILPLVQALILFFIFPGGFPQSLKESMPVLEWTMERGKVCALYCWTWNFLWMIISYTAPVWTFMLIGFYLYDIPLQIIFLPGFLPLFNSFFLSRRKSRQP